MTWLNVQVQTINTSFIHFPFNNFRYFLTLFSKFFSSFLHSTCSLSVSRLYLALDGIYHPLGLQSQATRLVGSAPYVFYLRHRTGLSPSMVQDSTWIIPVQILVTTPIDYNSLSIKNRDFQVELFPLHSPLLGEFLLVSYPPLNNMFKFSGYSCLTWAQKRDTSTTRHYNVQNPASCLTALDACIDQEHANAWKFGEWVSSKHTPTRTSECHLRSRIWWFT